MVCRAIGTQCSCVLPFRAIGTQCTCYCHAMSLCRVCALTAERAAIPSHIPSFPQQTPPWCPSLLLRCLSLQGRLCAVHPLRVLGVATLLLGLSCVGLVRLRWGLRGGRCGVGAVGWGLRGGRSRVGAVGWALWGGRTQRLMRLRLVGLSGALVASLRISLAPRAICSICP